ncbi:hypothetical protein LOK74_15050 [Brevibacillus humidisoli]|uniref:hypothetical protein n=1 Tax=Brevibacillus humidisoli TaxID=2895522 RepID=UPI001E63D103|nr:hypothetical protein [Brevibacillus humidisoli]UFJ39385.1 hypothetical protein LOK74_15050 [Brevibacillus humidisoli]
MRTHDQKPAQGAYQRNQSNSSDKRKQTARICAFPSSPDLTPSALQIMQLQKIIGNQAVTQMLQSGFPSPSVLQDGPGYKEETTPHAETNPRVMQRVIRQFTQNDSPDDKMEVVDDELSNSGDALQLRLERCIEENYDYLTPELQEQIYKSFPYEKFRTLFEQIDQTSMFPNVEKDAFTVEAINQIIWQYLSQQDTPTKRLSIKLDAPKTVDKELAKEMSRQMRLQLEGLNKLTAKQWLTNAILNRMKTTEQKVSDYTTKEGTKIANLIDNALLQNDDLARMILREIQMRTMVQLQTFFLEKTDVPKEYQQLLKAIDTALSQKKEVYLAFRKNKGLEILHTFTVASVSGGIGRQHGEGDEKWFRKQFADGVKLVETIYPGRLKKNAVIHNPDQCAGGPYEILWQQGREKLLALQQRYQEAAFQYKKQHWLVEDSYRKQPPKKSGSGEIDHEKIAEEQRNLNQLKNRLLERTQQYVEAMLHHIGNYDVNSSLGEAWMDKRVGRLILDTLNIPMEQLDSTLMDVQMDLPDPGKNDMQPLITIDTIEDALPEHTPNPKKRAKEKETKRVGKRLKKASEKVEKGPKQISLFDWSYKNQEKQASSSKNKSDSSSKNKSDSSSKNKSDSSSEVKSDSNSQHKSDSNVDLNRYNITRISGEGFNCYIRSIVTGTPEVPRDQIEHIVQAISDHLAHVGLRTAVDFIDAGGLVAAEVRRVIGLLTGTNRTPSVEIVMQGPNGYTRFVASQGDYRVILLYTPGHFSLLREK